MIQIQWESSKTKKGCFNFLIYLQNIYFRFFLILTKLLSPSLSTKIPGFSKSRASSELSESLKSSISKVSCDKWSWWMRKKNWIRRGRNSRFLITQNIFCPMIGVQLSEFVAFYHESSYWKRRDKQKKLQFSLNRPSFLRENVRVKTFTKYATLRCI